MQAPLWPTQRDLKRRGFSRAAASAALAPALPEILPAARGEAAAKARCIDVHTHLGRVWNQTDALTPEAPLRRMDAARIERAVVLTLVLPEPGWGVG